MQPATRGHDCLLSPLHDPYCAGADTQHTNAIGRRKTISSPSGVRFDPHDGSTLWVASYTASTIVRFNSSGFGSGRVWKVTD